MTPREGRTRIPTRQGAQRELAGAQASWRLLRHRADGPRGALWPQARTGRTMRPPRPVQDLAAWPCHSPISTGGQLPPVRSAATPTRFRDRCSGSLRRTPDTVERTRGSRRFRAARASRDNPSYAAASRRRVQATSGRRCVSSHAFSVSSIIALLRRGGKSSITRSRASHGLWKSQSTNL